MLLNKHQHVSASVMARQARSSRAQAWPLHRFLIPGCYYCLLLLIQQMGHRCQYSRRPCGQET